MFAQILYFGYWVQTPHAFWLEPSHGPAVSVIWEGSRRSKRWILGARGHEWPESFRSAEDAMLVGEAYKIQWYADEAGTLAPGMANQVAELHRMGDLAALRRALDDDRTPAGLHILMLNRLYAAIHSYRGKDGIQLARKHYVQASRAQTLDWNRSERLADLAFYVLGFIERSERKHAAWRVQQETQGDQMVEALASKWVFSDPRLDDVAGCVDSLRSAYEWEGGDPSAPLTSAAWEGARASIELAVGRGCAPELMQITLDAWASGAGGPRITVTVEQQASPTA